MIETFRSVILRLGMLAIATSSAAAAEDVALTRTAVEMGYGVYVFECDKGLQALATEDRQRKVQGRPVRICFQPNDVAMEDGVRIEQVDSWAWETAHEGGKARQAAVTDGRGDSVLSDLMCQDDGSLCVLDTILTGDFFKNRGSVMGEGEATLSAGTGRVPISKDIFQIDFKFTFTHGNGGEEMTDEEVQDIMKLLEEQEARMAQEGLASNSDNKNDEL
jgi:hypothetical protein